MSKYILDSRYDLRGWYGAKTGVYDTKTREAHFVEQSFYQLLAKCDAVHEIDENGLSEAEKHFLRKMKEEHIIRPAGRWDFMLPRQQYHAYPARYRKNVHWSITGGCNLRCRHCFMSAPHARHGVPDYQELLAVADQLAECGGFSAGITGGEPLMRDDFLKIVDALNQREIGISTIYTNGWLLDEKLLDALETSGVRPSFQLSFDGLGHHDWLRGVDGAEEQADKAFRLLKEHGYPVAVGMCIHRGNKNSLRGTMRYLSNLGVAALNVNAPQTLGVWKQYAEEYALTEDEVWSIYRDGIKAYFEDGMPLDLELDGYFFCRKGSTAYKVPYVHHPPENADWGKIPQCESMRHHIYIGAEGRLAPCMAFSDTEIGKTFPNVLKEHLGKLSLEGNSYYDVVNTRVSDFLRLNPECAECEHFPACGGGCMAQGMAQCGNHLARDERACYFHRHIGKQAVRAAADQAIENGKQQG